MARNIDQNIVEMRFDNKNFEKNASESMSTLDKLKEKLNFSGASKGVDELNKSVKNCDMSPLSKAVEGVHMKFSAFEVMATTALANITNSAVNAGKQLLESLTVDNISAGWDKFGKKTNAVATLTSQGFDIETVEKQLERLNFFTDETSYNFTDMVAEISKFTASGQGLEDSVTAMEGIASWAALSGQNAATASRAMYQLSQAMGSGTMRMQDWRSVQNANMDTAEFRQKALDAAVALGTLKKNADGTYRSLVADVKDGDFTIEQFTSHLTEDAWFTSDVMMAVYKDYGKAANTIQLYMEKYSDDISTASEAMENIEDKARAIAEEMVKTGEAANIDEALNKALQKVSLDELKDIPEVVTEAEEFMKKYNETLQAGQKPIETIEDALVEMGYGLDSFALKAFKAGQEARTFEDTIDAVKDAVSTGWMNTFQNIFGNADEAKKLWTDLANELYDVFAEGGNARNEMLASWKEMGGRNLLFDNTEDSVGAFWNLYYAITDVINLIKDVFHNIFPPMTAEKLLKMTEQFKEFTEGLRLNKKETGELRQIFRGLFSALDLIGRTVVAVIKGFSPLKRVFDDLKDNIKESLIGFSKWSIKTDAAAKGLNKFAKITEVVAKVVGAVVNVFYDLSEAIGALFTTDTSKVDTVGGKITARFSKILELGQKILTHFGKVAKVFALVYEKLKPIFIGLFDMMGKAVDSVINSLTDSLGNLDANSIIKMIQTGLGAGIILAIKGIIDNIKSFGGITDLLKSITDAFDGLSDYLGAMSFDKKAEALKKLAIAIAILVASLLILTLIDPDKLKDAIASITILFADLIASAAILSKSSKLSKSIGMTAIGFALIEMAAALVVLSVALKKIAVLSTEDLTKSLTAMGIAIKLLPQALNATNPKGATKKALSMILLATSLVILAVAMKKIAAFSWEEIAKGLAVMAIATQLLPATLNNTDKKGVFKKAISMILLTTSLVILAAAMKKIAAFSWEEIAKGLATMAIATQLLPAMLNNTENKGAFKKALSMILLTASLIILASAMKKIAAFSWEEIAKGLAVMAITSQLLPEVLNKTNPKGAIKKALTMILLTASLNILAAAMKELATLSWEGILKAVVSMGASLAIISLSINGTKSPSTMKAASLVKVVGILVLMSNYMKTMADVSWEGILKGIISMALCLAILTGALIAMEGIKTADATKLVIAAAALLLLATSLTMLSSVGWIGLLAGLGGLVATFIVLGVATKILAPMAADMLKVSTAMISFSVSMALMGIAVAAIGVGLMLIGSGLTAIGLAMPALASGMATLVPVFLEYLPQIISGLLQMIIQCAPEFAQAVITLIGSILEIFGTVVPQIVETLMYTIGLVLDSLKEKLPDIVATFFSLVLEVLTNLEAYAPLLIEKIVNIIIEILHGLSIRMPDIVEAVLEFIKALFGGILSVIGDLIGFLIGEIINTAGTVIADGLPHIGEKLSEFSEKIKPFLDMSGGISEDSMRGVKLLAETILLITAAELISGIDDFVAKFSGSSTSSFADKLVTFGEAMVEFADVTKDIDSQKVQGSALAAKALGEFANNLPKEGGLWQDLVGKGNLVQFGAQLELFGPQFASYAKSVEGITNVDAVVASANAATAMAEFANKLPKHGGFWQKLVGDSSLTTFANELNAFAPALVDYAEEVKTLDAEVVTNSIMAATSIKEFATNLPAHGGFWQKLAGDSSLTSFAMEMRYFAPALVAYADEVKDLDGDVVTKSATAASALAALEANLPDSGGVVSWFAGDNTLDGFAKELPNLAIGLRDYATNLGTNFDPSVVTSSVEAARALSDLQTALPDTGGVVSWFAGDNTIAKFAEGLGDFGVQFSIYYENIKGIDPDTVTSVTNSTSGLVEVCKQMKFVDTGAMKTFTGAFEELTNIGVDEFVKAFEGSDEKFISAAEHVVQTFNHGVLNNKDLVKNTFETLSDSADAGIMESETSYQGAGKKLGELFVNSFAAYNETLMTLCKNITKNGLNKITIFQSDYKNAGMNLMIGFINGMDVEKYNVNRKAEDIARGALTAIQTTIDAHSPSKETYKLGNYFGEGFVNALELYSATSYDSGELIGKMATEGVMDGLSDPSGSLIEPTIKPVIDLTDVEVKTSKMDDILNADVSANVANNISAMMGDYNSTIDVNVDNSDVIKELSDLRTELGTMGDKISKLQIVLDTGAMVGELTAPLDASLGSRANRRWRG